MFDCNNECHADPDCIYFQLHVTSPSPVDCGLIYSDCVITDHPGYWLYKPSVVKSDV